MRPPMSRVKRKQIYSPPCVCVSSYIIQFQYSSSLYGIYIYQIGCSVERHCYSVFLHFFLFLSFKPRNNKNEEERKKMQNPLLTLTKNLKVESGSPLFICVGDCGTAAEIMQINDSHWLRPSESPTNITFFPFILYRNSSPLNLLKKERKKEISYLLGSKKDVG